MIRTRKALIIVLVFPIASLLVLTGMKKYTLSFGDEVILPISGYDPRDLLSGHYLAYQIDYGVTNVCAGSAKNQAGYICLDYKLFTYFKPTECKKMIRGVCEHGRFIAGIEKFYVPQNRALELEAKIRLQKASVVLSVPESGNALVKDLLINGKSWRDQ